MEVCDQFLQVIQANRKAAELRSTVPHALSARYDVRIKRIMIQLSNRLEVALSPHDAEGLENATSEQLDLIEISPSGFGIYFPNLDADLYLPALMEGSFGTMKWMANHVEAAVADITPEAKFTVNTYEAEVANVTHEAEFAITTYNTEFANITNEAENAFITHEAEFAITTYNTEVANITHEAEVAKTTPKAKVARITPEAKVAKTTHEAKVVNTTPDAKVAKPTRKAKVANTTHKFKVAKATHEIMVATTTPEVKIFAARQNGRSGSRPRKSAVVAEFPSPRRLPLAERSAHDQAAEVVSSYSR